MTVERAVRLTGRCHGSGSLALAHWFSPYWLWLTVFVGLNLLQSAFTNWCPAMSFFRNGWVCRNPARRCGKSAE